MKNLAIFDLDHTLIHTDSDNAFPKFLIEQGLLDADYATAQNEKFYQDYLSGCLNVADFVRFQISPIAHLTPAQRNELHQQFQAQYIAPHASQAAKDLVNRHHRAGDELLVISSTNEYIIAPICQQIFGIDNIIGTQLETDANGLFTGNIVGTPSLQEGKITRLNQWLAARGETLASYGKTYFYSDSQNDLPLLNLVDEPVAVNPDATLLAHAQAHGWAVLRFDEAA